MGQLISYFINSSQNQEVKSEITSEITRLPKKPDEVPYFNLIKVWNYEYKLRNGITLQGHSRSAHRTCFFIRELSTYLDAGIQGKANPLMVLLTHGHVDHSNALPLMNVGLDSSTILMTPHQIEKNSYNYVMSFLQLNRSNHVQYNMNKIYQINGVKPYTNYPVTLKGRKYLVATFKCYHGVPCLGYGISEIRKKIKPEYQDLPKQELAKLGKSGIQLSQEVEFPLLVYLGDTLKQVFDDPQNQKIFTYPYIIVETTYLYDDQVDLAHDHNHIHWKDIIDIVIAHPQIEFILIHFSTRYRDDEIRDFFRQERDRLGIDNIIPWIN